MSSPLCPFSNVFGKPQEGVHSYRIMNVAVVDTLLTVLAAYIISREHFWKVLIGLFFAGILLHRLFCVRTTIDKVLFPNA